MTENEGLYPIGVVERDTGIGRDTLRIWERRYGFPEPVRNEKGERIYPEKQLRHLQRIRRLLDQGLRPGKVATPGREMIWKNSKPVYCQGSSRSWIRLSVQYSRPFILLIVDLVEIMFQAPA